MNVFVCVLVIVAVAAIVARPLMQPVEDTGTVQAPGDREWWEREKSIALTAIKEADFDLATGKLSDDDYSVLRNTYEERALNAMDELDRLGASGAAAGIADGTADEPGASAAYCTACGRAFRDEDRFCGSCGRARA